MDTYKKKFTLIAFNHENKIQVNCELCIMDQTIKTNFTVTGGIYRLELGEQNKIKTRKDKLWEVTCFELFFKNPKTPNYYEVNVSAAGDWNVFEFSDYRTNKKEAQSVSSPTPVIKSTGNNFNIGFEIKLNELSNLFAIKQMDIAEKSLLVGISCVLKQTNGEYLYYALKHQHEKPDFHLASNYETIPITRT